MIPLVILAALLALVALVAVLALCGAAARGDRYLERMVSQRREDEDARRVIRAAEALAGGDRDLAIQLAARTLRERRFAHLDEHDRALMLALHFDADLGDVRFLTAGPLDGIRV